MLVGIISGSGTYEWPDLLDRRAETVTTAHGAVNVSRGRLGDGPDVAHISRHGPGHRRLSNQVEHKANIAALLDLGVNCLLSATVCGAVDRSLALGSLIVFNDLYFPSNRLPDGSLCTWHNSPGEKGRGHWIFDGPFSEGVRAGILAAAERLGLPTTSGCYGHVDGPRFNTRSEIAALAGCGVSAVSQTAGPEVVLAGEAGLPMALVGYTTDYANGVSDQPEPVEALFRRMQDSTSVFGQLFATAASLLDAASPPGIVYRFD